MSAIGYPPVLAAEQGSALQHDTLTWVGFIRLLAEVGSGARADRPDR